MSPSASTPNSPETQNVSVKHSSGEPSSPLLHISDEGSQPPRKTEQSVIDPSVSSPNMNFDTAAIPQNDLSLDMDFASDFFSSDNPDTSRMQDFPQLPPSAAASADADISFTGLNSAVSNPTVPPPRNNLPHLIAPRHTFHPGLLNTLFTPAFITILLPPHLRSLSHTLPPSLTLQQANPAFGTNSTVTTSSFRTDSSNPIMSKNQTQPDAKPSTTVPQTQEERINERNRKGRERSLRTRRRNAFRLQTLERNVVYLITENNLLKDLVTTLSWLNRDTSPPASGSQSQFPHPLIIPFTALLLCALSRPHPYSPNNNRHYVSNFRSMQLRFNNGVVPAAPNPLLQAIPTPHLQPAGTHKELATGATESPSLYPTVKSDLRTSNGDEEDRIAPLKEEPVSPMMCETKSEIAIVESPNFKLSTDDFHLPDLNIDEIDMLLRESIPNSPLVNISPRSPSLN